MVIISLWWQWHQVTINSRNSIYNINYQGNILSFGANDTGELSSSWIDWTWQWSTEDFNRVEHCVVLCSSTNCDLRCLVPANVAGALSVRVQHFWCQISCILCGPAVRTLCSCWNHEDCWSTSHVANWTRRWVILQWPTAVVGFREYVVTKSSRIEKFIFYSGNFSRGSLTSIDIIFPLWIVR